jgi:RNA polymerase sigma-70 factor (ECF subfamily)
VGVERDPSLPIDDEYDRLFRESGPRVWRAVYAYTGGRKEIAEDAVAEAFARALERAETISTPVPWILRTAMRQAGEELRKERRQRRTEDRESVSPATGEAEDQAELLEALRRLSPNQRLAVVLRYTEEIPVSEIAQMMGTAVPTVRVHLFRGRNRLRRLLRPEGGPQNA